LDVTNCTLLWCLLDPNGNPVLPLDPNVSITKTDPSNGAIQIAVGRRRHRVAPDDHPEHRLRLSVEQARELVRLLQNLLDARP
jgi:hypothetical protein